eukprot:TRINITY_DN34677_c0_g1_i2.p1 TRINITY_DN34677_c0_g1~~TRINITY_DN34677_c0_g1_i2.p1  ORF type:complete len:373 (-),score=30.82 TRINITY_DN34677_c0_g1_i2:28-1146(-)
MKQRNAFLLGIQETEETNNKIKISKSIETEQKRLIAAGDPCPGYTDCFNCTSISGCCWSTISQCVSICDISQEWFEKKSICPSTTNTNQACPSNVTLDAGDVYSMKLPKFSSTNYFEKNNFCYWIIENPNELTLSVSIGRYSNDDLMAVQFGTEVFSDFQVKNILSMQTTKHSDKTIKIYYSNLEYMSSTASDILIQVEEDQLLDLSYVAIILLVLIGLIIIYGVITCIRLCMKNRSPPVVTLFQSREWLEGAEGRANRILAESPEGTFDKQSKFQELKCAICLDEFQERCPIRTLKCGHIFHKLCIESWIKAKINEIPKCPMCNSELTSERPQGMMVPTGANMMNVSEHLPDTRVEVFQDPHESRQELQAA